MKTTTATSVDDLRAGRTTIMIATTAAAPARHAGRRMTTTAMTAVATHHAGRDTALQVMTATNAAARTARSQSARTAATTATVRGLGDRPTQLGTTMIVTSGGRAAKTPLAMPPIATIPVPRVVRHRLVMRVLYIDGLLPLHLHARRGPMCTPAP